MTVKELYDYLDAQIPRALSCAWDNDGLMCCSEPERQVRRVLLTLDVTDEAISAAIERGCDVILSHHPLIFRGLGHVVTEDAVGGRVIRLLREGIAAMSFHTRLDALTGGVNDKLAARLGLTGTVPFGEADPVPMGRVGTLVDGGSPDIADFARLVREALGAEGVKYAGCGREVHRVAVLGGSGADFVAAAVAAGADTFVTGELKYHQLSDAVGLGINLVEAGHFETEAPVLPVFETLLGKWDSAVEVSYFDCNKIHLI